MKEYFRRKHGGTEVETIESTYGIDLHARGDAKLKNILKKRGFGNQTQLIDAYYRRLTDHARKRRVFLSFDYDDRAQVQGFRLMVNNPNVQLSLHDWGLQNAVNSSNIGYVHQVIKEKIERSEVLLVLIGNSTFTSKEVAWEIQTAIDAGKGICGIRLKGARGRAPAGLAENDAPVASWGDTEDLVAVIECAAARRS
jgi:hypothetical protein